MDNMTILAILKELGDSYDYLDLFHDGSSWILTAGPASENNIEVENTALVDCILQAYEKDFELKGGQVDTD